MVAVTAIADNGARPPVRAAGPRAANAAPGSGTAKTGAAAGAGSARQAPHSEARRDPGTAAAGEYPANDVPRGDEGSHRSARRRGGERGRGAYNGENSAERAAGDPAAKASGSHDAGTLAARAAKGRTVWSGWDELQLDGSASTGRNAKYHWRQTGGAPLTLRNADQAVATAAGLSTMAPGWRAQGYKFELTVTDETGAQDTVTVSYSVRAAPALVFRPAADRSFVQRDNYQIGHFSVWQTSYEGVAATFDMSGDSELTFTKIGGGNYGLTGGKTDTGYTYQVTIYPAAGEASTWVEFLVNTEEKIPAVVQLGVNWEPVEAGPLVP